MYSRTAIAVQLFLALAAATSTYGSTDSPSYDWVSDSLSDCLKDCLGKTDDGCHEQKCVCGASQSDNYLTSAAECARDKCEKSGLEINVSLLIPAQLYCSAVGSSIPDDNVKSAYECAMGGSAPSTHKSPTSTAKQQSEGALTSSVSSTFTMTTTNKEGHTLQVVQPVAMGPSTVSTGSAVTSTLGGSSSSATSPSTSSSAASSSSASSNQPVQASEAAPMQKSTSGVPSPTQVADDGDGSPFVNMQADATQRSFSGPLVALGLLAGAFMRL